MKKITFHTTLLAALLMLPQVSPASNDTEAEKSPHWTYQGDTGPSHWGDLSPEFRFCSIGKNQSPVDIDSKRFDANLPPIELDYNILTPTDIVNNGHTIQVNMWSGGEIKLDGINFELKQFHFHAPSENTIDGKHFPLEAHFVHASDKGELAVVAILFAPGPDDPTLKRLLEDLPMGKGESNKLASNAIKTLQTTKSLSNYYRYNGSLTTPPCTEGVRWVVMKRPFSVSKQQVEQLQKALKEPNNRPTQPLNARAVIE